MMFRDLSLQHIAVMLPALIFAFTIHELSHGIMAYILGDSTAKHDGRLTLNPIRHIDPVGLICILLFSFGWAKPVMVDMRNLKNPKVDMALIAIAGPISNFIMAFVAIMLWFPLMIYLSPPEWLSNVIIQFGWINILLGVFNLIPIPPLDGSKVIASLLPDGLYIAYNNFAKYGIGILLLFMIFGVTGRVIMPIINAIFEFYWNVAMSMFLG